MKESLQRKQAFDLEQPLEAVGADLGFALQAASRLLARQYIYDALAPRNVGKMIERVKEPCFVHLQCRRGGTGGRIGMLKNRWQGGRSGLKDLNHLRRGGVQPPDVSRGAAVHISRQTALARLAAVHLLLYPRPGATGLHHRHHAEDRQRPVHRPPGSGRGDRPRRRPRIGDSLPHGQRGGVSHLWAATPRPQQLVPGARLQGAMEITRGPGYYGSGQVRVWHEEWDVDGDQPKERTYVPDWPEHADLARQAGHGGGDFWTNFDFANAIRSGEQPFLDVYRGVAMSSVGILGWKSALEDGTPFEVPDFSQEASRKAYADDHWSPWPEDAGPGQPPPSILGKRKPTRKGLANARRVWKEIGYKGD